MGHVHCVRWRVLITRAPSWPYAIMTVKDRRRIVQVGVARNHCGAYVRADGKETWMARMRLVRHPEGASGGESGVSVPSQQKILRASIAKSVRGSECRSRLTDAPGDR